MGAGAAHPWQEDDEANSEIGDSDVFIVESGGGGGEGGRERGETGEGGEVRQRVIGAFNPVAALRLKTEVEEEGKLV